MGDDGDCSAGRVGEVAAVQDPRVTDPLALAEIELYGELVIAASASQLPLSRGEIDRILGVRPPAR